MDKLSQIKEPVKAEFARYEKMYDESFATTNPLLKQVYSRVTERKGKQLRPIMLLLAAKACGEVTEASYYSALVLELLHNTTLIHDDVVDEAQIRRGQPSINKEFGNKVAVLAGDYLLAQIFWLANMIGERKILKAVSELGKELSDGEILQLMHTGDPDFAVQRYIEVITKKTAVLFSTCMYAGAVSSGKVDDKTCETLRSFGNDLGICFQMKDDIFDYSYASEQIGKPVGNDIREKKITLPLIYAYAAADQEEKAKMDTMLKSEDNLSEEQVRWVVDLVRRHNGVEKTEQKMKVYQASALEKIDVAEGECRDSLVEMLRYVAERDK